MQDFLIWDESLWRRLDKKQEEEDARLFEEKHFIFSESDLSVMNLGKIFPRFSVRDLGGGY